MGIGTYIPYHTCVKLQPTNQSNRTTESTPFIKRYYDSYDMINIIHTIYTPSRRTGTYVD